jgi:hypothetical protein
MAEFETMENKEGGGKWAAEAYDFVRFLQRDGKRLSGLLVLQIGWLLLVILLTNSPVGKFSPHSAVCALENTSLVGHRDVFKLLHT